MAMQLIYSTFQDQTTQIPWRIINLRTSNLHLQFFTKASEPLRITQSRKTFWQNKNYITYNSIKNKIKTSIHKLELISSINSPNDFLILWDRNQTKHKSALSNIAISESPAHIYLFELKIAIKQLEINENKINYTICISMNY